MDQHEWFKQAQYGMMAHWGLYSLLAGEYKGKRAPHYGEWIQARFAIPNSEYHQLAKIFNPIYFNADEWIRLAKEAGMRYFVLTSKHHDGFALFHSKADPFNVVDATPFGRDICAELAEACYKHGLKFGLYYSQELDWSHPDGGGYTNTEACDGVSWENSWDFPDKSRKDFARCFEEKIKPQVKEILTGYGDLCLIWFDVPNTISPAQSLELYQMVKEYQPGCLINSRLGNGAFDYVSLGDNEVPESLPTEPVDNDKLDMNSIEGFKYSPYNLYETAATLNDTWGFKYFDQNWKSADEVYRIKTHLNEMGINYLLNVGPDALGRIPSFSEEILCEVGKKIAQEK